MASKKQRQDAIKKREKRSKLALIACAVLFVAVAAYEVPSILAMMNKKPAVPAAPRTAPSAPAAAGTATGLPNIAGTIPTAAPKSGLVNTDVPPASAAGQLVTFEVFQTKNPFTPQVTASAASAVPAAGAAAAGATSPGASVSTSPGAASITMTPPTGAAPPTMPGQGIVPPPTTTPGSPSTTTTTTVAAPAPTVSISVNGVVGKVSSGGTFPSGAPVFRLASYTRGSAQIGVVGGSYQTGGQTLTLVQGVPVTLQNTTDGKQYRLELLSTP